MDTLTPAPHSFRTSPDAALKDFQKNGFHIELDLFPESHCKKLIAAAMKLKPAIDETFAPVMHPHLENDPVFFDTFRSPQLLQIMEKLVGGRVDGIQSTYYYGRPGTPGFALHQDNFYVQAPTDAFASAWLPLVPVDSENGGLVVYPGSHVEPLLPVHEVEGAVPHPAQDRNANRLGVDLPPGKYNPVNLVIRPGSVFFIHSHVLHSSHNNASLNRFRHVLLMTFVRKGAPFRKGDTVGRRAFELYQP